MQRSCGTGRAGSALQAKLAAKVERRYLLWRRLGEILEAGERQMSGWERKRRLAERRTVAKSLGKWLRRALFAVSDAKWEDWLARAGIPSKSLAMRLIDRRQDIRGPA